jgi:hypothetical protein
VNFFSLTPGNSTIQFENASDLRLWDQSGRGLVSRMAVDVEKCGLVFDLMLLVWERNNTYLMWVGI